jgi:hypothetical protein
VIKRGTEVRPVVEMMSGAIWVRDTLVTAGWEVQIAHARKVRDVAPLACNTDKVDARVLAGLCRRELVPELHRAEGQPVRRPITDRSVVEGGIADAALGRRRSRPTRRATHQPLAPALHRRRQTRRQEPRQNPPSPARS